MFSICFRYVFDMFSICFQYVFDMFCFDNVVLQFVGIHSDILCFFNVFAFKSAWGKKVGKLSFVSLLLLFIVQFRYENSKCWREKISFFYVKKGKVNFLNPNSTFLGWILFRKGLMDVLNYFSFEENVVEWNSDFLHILTL